jgi:preprotein translocase subunit YajC
MLFALQLIAQGQEQTAPAWAPMMWMLPAIVIGYFLLFRPMRQQEKQRQALMAALKKNDKVITQGGIIGIVASVKDKEDEVTLKVDESSNVKIRVTRSSIVKIISADEPAKESKEGG